MAKKTAFLSRSPNQQVVVDPGREELRDPQGAVLQTGRSPRFVNFVGNRLETDDADAIKRLREDDLFQHPNGWWEEGKAPDEPKPTRESQNKAITRATAQGDVDKLEEIRTEELNTHNRRDVLENIDEAVAAITVPQDEEAGVVHRADLPAEKDDALPKVDRLNPPGGTALEDVDLERHTRSEDVAEERAIAQAAQEPDPEPKEPTQPIDEKIEAEFELAQDPPAEGEKLVDKMAGAETAPKPKATAGKKKSSSKKSSKSKSASTSQTSGAVSTGQRTVETSKSTASGANDGDSGKSS
jgi:hypothetical protein